MKRHTSTAAVAVLCLFGAGNVKAGFLSGLGSPPDAIPGGTVVDFESTPTGTYSGIDFGGVTISGAPNTNS